MPSPTFSPFFPHFQFIPPLPKRLLRIILEMKLYSAAIGGIVFLQIYRLFHFILGLLPEAMLLQPGDQPLAECPGNTKCCQHCSDDLNCHECISSAFNDCFPQLMFIISDSGLVFNHFRNGRFGFSARVFSFMVQNCLIPFIIIVSYKKVDDLRALPSGSIRLLAVLKIVDHAARL